MAKATTYNTIKGTDKSDWLTGSYAEDDLIYAGAGNDTLFGYGGDDILFGHEGNDYLSGGSGNDILDGGAGADRLNGGSGTDTASYENSLEGVQVNWRFNTSYGGDAEGDTFSSIENLTGSNFRDSLFGDDGDNVIKGLDGDDEIVGFGGNDTIYGGAGNDGINGSDGDDILDGGDGDDLLIGDFGNDTFIGSQGADQLYGGAGTDTVTYANSNSAVGVDLKFEGDFGDAEGDYYSAIENVIGSNYGDTLRGNGGANVIEGGGGNDLLYDNAGDDKVYGGDGDDEFYAGSGADTYVGGNGIDWLQFLDSETGVEVNLATGVGVNGYADGDSYSGIEWVTGSAHADKLVGDDGDNLLVGGDGEDLILDGLGDDILVGDDLNFNFGYTDTFAFRDTQGPENDFVFDFEVGIDKIDFTATDFFGFNDLTNGGDRYMEQEGLDTVIHYYDHRIILQNVDSNQLSADDFLFA